MRYLLLGAYSYLVIVLVFCCDIGGYTGDILVLDASLALVVDEATTAASGPLTAKVGFLSVAARLALANATTNAEQDGCNEEAGEGAPGEAVGVSANAGLLAGRAEGVAADDGPGAGRC